MDAIFTLPYSEYAAANMLAEHFKPSKGYSQETKLAGAVFMRLPRWG